MRGSKDFWKEEVGKQVGRWKEALKMVGGGLLFSYTQQQLTVPYLGRLQHRPQQQDDSNNNMSLQTGPPVPGTIVALLTLYQEPSTF